MALQTHHNVKISVERLLEQEVQEISRDGQESYIKPFTLSEELSYFASKIDFHGTHEDLETLDENNTNKKQKTDDEKKEEQGVDGESVKESRWQWETVHSKLRIALSEVCVMLDVLECLHRKKYLVLDPISQNPEPNKQTVQMLGIRKCLAQVGALIQKGARSLSNKKLSNGDSSIADGPITVFDNIDEYYMQLMHLRQYWRVKKTGTQIMGDVTYRSVGSHFWHPGLLEVKAAHDQTGSGVDQRKLVVNISPDLMQLSRLTVEIFDKNSKQPWVATTTDLPPWNKGKTAFDWESDLQLAQSHLFNLEIFSLLSNDAFQGSYKDIDVLDARICCRILDDVEVFISHHVGEYKKPKVEHQTLASNDLTLLLSDLLLQYHSRNIKSCSLYPATSNRLQKPIRSSSVHNLLNSSFVNPFNCILEDFLEEAKHKIWVTRLMNYLDEKSKNIHNSVLIMHWNVIKYRLQSSANILIVTKSYAITITTSLLLVIDNEGFNVTFENAKNVSLPYDLDVLEELINLELKDHMIRIANSLCVQHGWFVVQSSPKYCAVNGSHGTHIQNGSIFYSPKHKRFLKLLVFNVTDVELSMTKSVEGSSTVHLDEQFKWLNVTYTTLPWIHLPGKTFAEKMEFVFLCA